jgi:regulator of sigma E protease
MGHFLTARKFGVKAEEFGMGLPPRAIGIQKFEGKWRWVGKREIQPGEPMVYSLNWIPVGGFVKIKGENGEAAADADSFGHKKIWQRTVILAAGVTMNVALCIFLLSAGFMIGMPTSVDNNHGGKFISEPKVQITEVLADYPAAAADLKAGDIIVSIDNMVIKSGDELKVYLEARENQAVTVKIQRGTAELEKTITVVKKNEIIGFGIGIIDVGVVRYPWYLAIREGVAATWFWFVAIIMAVVGLFKELFGGPSAGLDFAGPVGIAVMTGQAAKMGWIYVLQFTALLSLNLAIINILPFPALDGGRILFLAIEKIRDKAVDSKLENLFHNIGFILLMVLIVAITYRDLAKYGLKILQALGRLVGIGN